MPGVYLVTPKDVADELPKLYPSGFSATSTPPKHVVEGWIADFDSEVALRVQRFASVLGEATDQAALIMRRIIMDRVKEQVMYALNAGRAPEQVEAAGRPFKDSANHMLKSLVEFGSQLVGSGNVKNRVRGTADADLRAMLITDDMLGDYDGAARTKSF